MTNINKMTNQFTHEQLEIIREKIKPIFEHLQRKRALELVRAMVKRIVDLEMADQGLYKNCLKLIAQLKWVACPLIKNDEEFLELVEKYFLEGLELDVKLIDLVIARLELQFGVGLEKSINDILSALRSNKQKLGANPIQIKRESSSTDPLIKNWLVDFIRNAETKNPLEMEETNYLFNNQNAKNLSENDKKTLGKILSFYDTFKLYADRLTQKEGMPKVSPPPVQPSSAIPSPIQPTKPPTPSYQIPKQTIPGRRDLYKEPVEEPPRPGRVEPRIEGNIVDLKNRQ